MGKFYLDAEKKHQYEQQHAREGERPPVGEEHPGESPHLAAYGKIVEDIGCDQAVGVRVVSGIYHRRYHHEQHADVIHNLAHHAVPAFPSYVAGNEHQQEIGQEQGGHRGQSEHDVASYQFQPG